MIENVVKTTHLSVKSAWETSSPLTPYYSRDLREQALRVMGRMKLRGSAGPAVKNRNFSDEIRPFQVEFLIFQNLENDDSLMLEY